MCASVDRTCVFAEPPETLQALPCYCSHFCLSWRGGARSISLAFQQGLATIFVFSRTPFSVVPAWHVLPALHHHPHHSPRPYMLLSWCFVLEWARFGPDLVWLFRVVVLVYVFEGALFRIFWIHPCCCLERYFHDLFGLTISCFWFAV